MSIQSRNPRIADLQATRPFSHGLCYAGLSQVHAALALVMLPTSLTLVVTGLVLSTRNVNDLLSWNPSAEFCQICALASFLWLWGIAHLVFAHSLNPLLIALGFLFLPGLAILLLLIRQQHRRRFGRA